MEDIKIWRRTRFQQVINQQAIGAGNLFLIPGNANRLSLVIAATSMHSGNIVFCKTNSLTSAILRLSTGGNAGGEMPVYDGFSIAPSEPFYTPTNPHIFHIRDYGQMLLSDLWFGPVNTAASFNVWETFLIERESSDL